MSIFYSTDVSAPRSSVLLLPWRLLKTSHRAQLKAGLFDFVSSVGSVLIFTFSPFASFFFFHWSIWLICCCLVAKLCQRFCHPTDCSPPGSSVHGISRQEYWSGLPFPSPGDLPRRSHRSSGLIPGSGRSPGAGHGNPLMATHSSILAWRISWTEEPERLQSMGSQRVRYYWAAEHT